jgi:hypothetical protein
MGAPDEMASLSDNPQPEFPSSFETRGRWRDLMELVVGYALILLVIWIPRPWQRWFYWAAIVWILAVVPGSFREWEMGLRVAGFRRSLWIFGAALIASGIAIAIAARLGTLHFPPSRGRLLLGFLSYGVWAFVQQFLLQDFFLLRLLRLTQSAIAAVTMAVGMFMVAHLPNPVLTPASLLWGAISCVVFLRYRNLYTLGMAHAVLGITIAITVPGPVVHNMRVGLGYMRYRAPHYRNQIAQTVSTNAWVRAEAATRRSETAKRLSENALRRSEIDPRRSLRQARP